MVKILILKNPVFDEGQLARLSNIFDNMGQVVLGVVVLTPLISSFDKVNWLVILCGLIVTIACWLISVRLAKIKR